MKTTLQAFAVAIGLAMMLGGCASGPESGAGGVGVVAMPGVGDGLLGMVVDGKGEVERFFGEPYGAAFEVREFGTAAEMGAFAKGKWGVPELPCWAVAMGSGSGLVVLNPEVWKTEACDHGGDTGEDVRRIVTHECVHVYHGQRNPDPEFERSDEIGWFVEGLAVYASGQLDEGRMWQARQAVQMGRGPRILEDAWSGKARYGVAGSMARFVDERVGRAEVVRLLGAETSAEILKSVGMSEAEFLAAWEVWLKAG